MAELRVFGLVRYIPSEIELRSDPASGSSLHCMRALRYPRWEDYNYERADSSKNRLYWLGDGMTHNEVTLSGNSELSYRLCIDLR